MHNLCSAAVVQRNIKKKLVVFGKLFKLAALFCKLLSERLFFTEKNVLDLVFFVTLLGGIYVLIKKSHNSIDFGFRP